MPHNRLRIFWALLCLLLIAALVGGSISTRKKLRTAEQRLEKAEKAAKKAKAKTGMDKRDSAYFNALAQLHGYIFKPPLAIGDAARLAAYDRIEFNKLSAIARGTDPTTFPGRNLDFMHSATFAVTPKIEATLPEAFTHYRYSLTNKSDRTLPTPILYQSERWDSAEALVAQAGFKTITNETDRAIAIWRYVCVQRVFGPPPTEGKEEHDVLKFLAIYGYGFCDDTARAVATLADRSGLKGRIWALEGHLVAEIFADGKWRMFDADQQAFLHRSGAPKDILGVEELSADRAGFEHAETFRPGGVYPKKFLEYFLTRKNNKLDDGGTSGYRLQPVLRAGESLTFTNYNWGRYFLGKFPEPPPRLYNGYFTYRFHPRDLVAGKGKIESEEIDGGFRLRNPGNEPASASLVFEYPFPIVGGTLNSTTTVRGTVDVRLEEAAHDRFLYMNPAEGLKARLDRFVSVLASDPTYQYTLTFTLSPGTDLDLRKLVVTSEIQLAQLALVKLKPGANEIQAHLPDGTDPAAFEVTIETE